MRFPLKQIAFAGLLACLGASASATNYFFVQPKSIDMSKASPLSVALNPSALPDAVVGLAYNNGAGFNLKSVLVVSGDSGFNPALTTFGITSGTLPSGLTVSANGMLSGTPTVASAGSAIQVTATYKTASGVQSYQVISLNLTVSLAAATLPQASVGTLYNITGYDFKPSLSVTGDASYTVGQASFKLTEASAALPTGLSISSAGVLNGTPSATTAGTSFTVQSTYKTQTAQQTYTIIVNGATLQVVSMSAGASHTCAVSPEGGVQCWGLNNYGQLGDGTSVNKSVPTAVLGLLSGVTSISAGANHTCAILTTGGVKCWGFNNAGQLGDDTTATRLVPTEVSGLASGVANISAGQGHTCVVTTSGEAKCWGSNNWAQLGDNTITPKLVPTSVTGLGAGVASISLGSSHTCALLSTGGVMCWGNNTNGQLGSTGVTYFAEPRAVSGLASGVTGLDVGSNHACVVLASGAVKCWGVNAEGQVGDGTQVSTPAPTAVTGLTSGVASVVAGKAHSCAITTTGGIKCWGYNFYGNLGDGTEIQQKTAVDVLSISGATAVTAGANHTCATTSSGAKCWGYNNQGQLGDGTLLQKNKPVAVLR